MRALSVLVTGLTVLLAGGCGGGGSAEDEVRSAWEAAARAVADDRATQFCSLVSVITGVDVRGEDATVSYEATGSLAKVGFTGRTTMREEDGRWVLNGL